MCFEAELFGEKLTRLSVVGAGVGVVLFLFNIDDGSGGGLFPTCLSEPLFISNA
jgi:hypothetical protein